MKIIKITRSNFNEWLDLALKLWADQSSQEMQESLANILKSEREAGFLVRNANGKTMGFINLSLRYDYVAGATNSPVAYVEGIYVKDEYRNQGVGKYLIEFASRWALEHGCTELASDALIENTASYDFHTKVGFQEVERVVTFIKQISL
ncbi:GCN5-related N-acetyltransferase [Crinalium epipsammum PCC 9333]|uniref:Aminoglycoside N(6')-acetyltransferase type 1 n=1 Tax=Crinalium epipsammum PCC 9333 TaxID=1173022 RepID=K9VTA4_9CYAN|nr:aminoglycoside 6'-N-acetyltransferase [Crinalium epipsammum]AFZ11303.1 GCN5-related N-acetyltransferase [Crinalium epipsammum PCC 9333]